MLLLILIAMVAICEMIVATLINGLQLPFNIEAQIIDALFTVLLTFPVFYFLVYKRFSQQILLRQQLEDSLLKAKAEYEGIVEDQTELICQFTPDEKIIFVNGALCRYFNLPAKEIVGNEFSGAIYPDDLPRIRDLISNLNLERSFTSAEFRLIGPQGDPRWFSANVHAIYFDSQTVSYYQAVARDISLYKQALTALQEARDGLEIKVQQRTAEMARANLELKSEITIRKSTENALRTSQSHLQQLIAQIPAVLWTMDTDLALTSLLGSRLTELQPELEKILRVDLRQISAPDGAEKPEAQAHLKALQGVSADFELVLANRKYHCSVEPFRDLEGKIVGCLGIALDVTARKVSEEIIHLQTTTLEAAADGILIADQDGLIRWVNSALTAMTGYSAAELVGRNPSVFNSGHHSKEFYANLWNTILSGQVWHGETYNRRKDGSIYVEEQTITPVQDSSGRLANYIAIKHDITDRKEAEKKITRRNWELQAINTLSSALTASLDLSHRLDVVRRLLHEELEIPAGAIFSFDPERNTFNLETAWGRDDTHLGVSDLTLGDHYQAMREKKPVLITNRSSGEPGEGPQAKPQEFLCIPLLSQGEVQGILHLSLNGSKIISSEPLSFFESLGNQIGVAIHNAKLFKAETQARRMADTLRLASLTLGQSLDLDVVIRNLIDSVGQCVPETARISLYLRDEAGLQVKAVGGTQTAVDSSCHEKISPADYPLIARIEESHTAQWIEDTAAEPLWRPILSGFDTRSWLGIPILAGGNVIGLCCLESEKTAAFTPAHTRLIEALLGQAAATIQNARLYQEVRTGRERLQALSRRLVEIQEMERRYIARELHDETSQALVGLVYALEILKRDAGNPSAVAASVEELDRLIGDILNNLHRLAVDLRPAALDHLGLVPAIRQYIDGIREKHNLAIDLEVQELPGRLPAMMETTLYRVIQEALANVIRHSKATQATIQIGLGNDQIGVLISDNGQGFDLEEALAKERLGLFGMRERVEMLGGNLKIESAPASGTQISLEVPYALSNLDR